MTHICVSNLTIIGLDNGLSPGRRQAIIWTNAGILLIRLLGTNFNEMFIEILTFSFMKMRLKVSSAKWRPFCLGLNVLNQVGAFFCHRASHGDVMAWERFPHYWSFGRKPPWITSKWAGKALPCCKSKQDVEQTVESSVVWDAMTSMWRQYTPLCCTCDTQMCSIENIWTQSAKAKCWCSNFRGGYQVQIPGVSCSLSHFYMNSLWLMALCDGMDISHHWLMLWVAAYICGPIYWHC